MPASIVGLMPMTSLVALAMTAGLTAAAIMAMTLWHVVRARALPARPGWLRNLLFAPLIVAVLAAIPFFLSALISAGLAAVEAPATVYVLIAVFAGWSAWLNRKDLNGGMESCGRLMALIASIYFVCWALASLVLVAPEPFSAASVVDALRCLLVASPFALFVGRVARKGQGIRHGIFALLLLASLSAIAFLPVEQGAADRLLPDSDWLRFPIAGAVIACLWLPLAVVLTLTVGSGSRGLADVGRGFAVAAGIGGLFGLVWAITRALFALI